MKTFQIRIPRAPRLGRAKTQISSSGTWEPKFLNGVWLFLSVQYEDVDDVWCPDFEAMGCRKRDKPTQVCHPAGNYLDGVLAPRLRNWSPGPI